MLQRTISANPEGTGEGKEMGMEKSDTTICAESFLSWIMELFHRI